MKNLSIGVIACLFVLGGLQTGHAQKLGAAPSFIFDGSTIGIQGRYEHTIRESVDAAAQFTYFPENGGAWAVDVDGHYMLSSADGISLYPLAGINLIGGNGDTDLGLNVGLGGSFNINDNFQLFSEFKYVLISTKSAVLTAGILYPF